MPLYTTDINLGFELLAKAMNIPTDVAAIVCVRPSETEGIVKVKVVSECEVNATNVEITDISQIGSFFKKTAYMSGIIRHEQA